MHTDTCRRPMERGGCRDAQQDRNPLLEQWQGLAQRPSRTRTRARGGIRHVFIRATKWIKVASPESVPLPNHAPSHYDMHI